MAKRNKRVIVWDGARGIAPDGTEYSINSEQIRGEPRNYWAEFHGKEIGHPTDTWAISLDKAKQAAEAHYRAKILRATS